jgi:hypothetical protein
MKTDNTPDEYWFVDNVPDPRIEGVRVHVDHAARVLEERRRRNLRKQYTDPESNRVDSGHFRRVAKPLAPALPWWARLFQWISWT